MSNKVIVTSQEEWDNLPESFDTFTIIEIRTKDYLNIYCNPSNSSVRLYNNSSAILYDNSSVKLYDNSSAELYNNSSVKLYGSSSAELYGNSSVKLYENSTGIILSSNVKYESFDLSVISNQITKAKVPFNTWIERNIVFCDGIYRDLISSKTIGDLSIYETDDGYVVKKGDKFSHGETIEKAKEDLIYKLSDRDKSHYEDWALDTVKPLDEMIESYRVITGACEFGVKDFCSSITLKDEYSVLEVIDMTEGKYGNFDYKEFFK